ncbi:MAG: hypothetical protein ACK2TV_00885, partial [Anaerolineales bacterium]
MPGNLPGVELQESSNRGMLLAMGGFFLLGIALVLLLFSGPLLDGFKAETPANLPQIPAAVENLKDGNPAVNALVTGDQAAEFTLSDLEGNNVSLSDFVGQPLMVN